MKDETSFEKAIEELEKIVETLEKGDIGLDETLKLFERGMELNKLCSEKLHNIERRIEILVNESGKIKPVPFEEDDN